MPSTSYMDRIREARPKLSKSFKRLADYILDSYIQAALMTASELAHQVNVDSATVVRFAQALDYSGFPQLQDEIKERVLEELHLDPKKESTANTMGEAIDLRLQNLVHSLERTRRLIDKGRLEELIKRLAQSKKILVISKNNYQALAIHFAHSLGKIGLVTKFTALEADELAEEIAAGNDEDFILVIDMDGKSKLLGAAIVQAKSFGLMTGAIAGGASFESARKADIVLEIHSHEDSESNFLLLAAVLESIADSLQGLMEDDFLAYEAKLKKARARFAKLN